MNLKKVVTWLVVAFVVFYVIQAPEQSAQLVRDAGNALGDAASRSSHHSRRAAALPPLSGDPARDAEGDLLST